MSLYSVPFFVWAAHKNFAVLVINLHQNRFINLVESLDQDTCWEHLKTVRENYLNKNKESSCQKKYLLPNENINENIELFMNLLNVSSSNLQKNLTKDVINKGAKMFIYLNSCSKTSTKLNLKKFFENVFEKQVFQKSTNSGKILYILRAMKLFSNDGRIIASKILEKISNLFELSLIQSQKDHLTTKSMFIYLRFSGRGSKKSAKIMTMQWKQKQWCEYQYQF